MGVGHFVVTEQFVNNCIIYPGIHKHPGSFSADDSCFLNTCRFNVLNTVKYHRAVFLRVSSGFFFAGENDSSGWLEDQFCCTSAAHTLQRSAASRSKSFIECCGGFFNLRFYLRAVMNFNSEVSSQDDASVSAFLTLLFPAGKLYTALIQHLLWIILGL